MSTGTVKFFNVSKGFGFITPDEGEKDVFMPATSLIEAGISNLKPGQRLTFETEPHSRGPKAIKLLLLIETGPTAVSQANAFRPAKQPAGLTFYHDPNSNESIAALNEIRAAGHQPHVVDYLFSPPNRHDLKRLSAVLNRKGQSLIAKSHPLFSELRLDDRFLPENEIWDAVIEHPCLINGPIVETPIEATLCHSSTSVRAFLGAIANGAPVAVKPKTLSDRALRFLRGETGAALATKEAATMSTPAPIDEREQDQFSPGTVVKFKGGKTELPSISTAKARPVATSKSAKTTSARRAAMTWRRGSQT